MQKKKEEREVNAQEAHLSKVDQQVNLEAESHWQQSCATLIKLSNETLMFMLGQIYHTSWGNPLLGPCM